MEIVNGYLCMNCCDIDKARLGQDPHQSSDQIQKQTERHIDKRAPANAQPAVIFGGSLQGSANVGGTSGNTENGGGSATAGAPSSPQPGAGSAPLSGVDLIV